MNKETFLKELQEYLRILEDQEQQDILEEYAQHIDMKIQKGLSEEEAIQDFGSVQQLAAEILEAYHVKPEFEQKKLRMKLPDLNRAASESKKTGAFVIEWIRKKVSAFGNGMKKGFCRTGEKIKGFWGWMTGLFRRKPKAQAFPQIQEESGMLKEEQMQENVLHKTESLRGDGKFPGIKKAFGTLGQWLPEDELALMMEAKDQILQDLKQGKISSYETKGIESVKVFVNPADAEEIQMN